MAPSEFAVCRGTGGASGVPFAHTDDVLGCGEADILPGRVNFRGAARGAWRASGSLAHRGAEEPHANDFSTQSAQENLTNAPEPIATTPDIWASRLRPLSIKEVLIRLCKLGGLRLSTTASRPDNCARVAPMAACLISSKGVTYIESTIWLKLPRSGEKEQYSSPRASAPVTSLLVMHMGK